MTMTRQVTLNPALLERKCHGLFLCEESTRIIKGIDHPALRTKACTEKISEVEIGLETYLPPYLP